MTTEHVNRETVERRRERVLSEYGDVRVEEVRHEVPAADFPGVRDACRDGYVGSGYAWVVREPEQAASLTESMPDDLDERRRVLFILGRGESRWGIPGGGLEGEETYAEATVREVREETGIDCELGDAYALREYELVSAGDHDDVLHTMAVFFDAEYRDGHVAIQPGELNGAAWFADPPERLHPPLEPRAARFWDEFEPEND